MSNNKKQSMTNPYTGKRMVMNTYSGRALSFQDPNAANRFDELTSDEYYDYWEDDRLYQQPEGNKYE